MRNSFLAFAAAILLLAQPVRAQITLTATPSTQLVDLSSTNLFNVTISISGAPANMIGFDLWLETLAANSGYFSIVSATPSASSPFDFPSGPGTYPDVINTANSNHAGFAQNAGSQGFTSSSPVTYNGDLVTLQLSVNAGTPEGSYSFSTTQFATSGNRGSSVTTFSGGTNTQFVDNPATFSVTVVPEPTTWSLLVFGGLAAAAAGRLKLRR